MKKSNSCKMKITALKPDKRLFSRTAVFKFAVSLLYTGLSKGFFKEGK